MFFIYKEFLLFLGELFYVLKFYKQSLYFYKKVYDEGFNKGLKALEKIKDEARALGRAGKDESELDKFKEGRNERLDRERLMKLLLGFMGITIIGIGFVLIKMKNEKEYDIAISYAQGVPTFYVASKVKAKKKYAWVNVRKMLENQILAVYKRIAKTA